MYTDMYLHTKSKHNPPQEQAILKMLNHQVRAIRNAESLGKETDNLRKIHRQNGCSSHVKHTLGMKQKM
jgi:hypothetical protein